MADITAVVAALNEGKSARRKRWNAQSSIYLNEQNILMRRLNKPVLGTQEVAVEIDWNDLTASDWILLEPMSNRPRQSSYIN
ncbi:MAG TPA: hypothetical protein VH250_00965 [Granulicella sp.]|nr:hypothetical protein [Granulicella sp.]